MAAGRGNVCPGANASNQQTLGCDPLGRPIFENEIYDPASTFVVNGQRVRNPYVGNAMPVSQMDPVAVKIQSCVRWNWVATTSRLFVCASDLRSDAQSGQGRVSPGRNLTRRSRV